MATTALPNVRFTSIGLIVPVFIVALLAMMIVPLPPILLDLFFAFNIALSLVVLLVVVYTLRPLDFAVFPAVLLVTTLLRLGLNVASTRVVLLNGNTGPDAAGHVIEAFGDFVIGGNTAVGLVVFAILVIINFVVVTKGAGRVSEVSARFTLDAMPGKQMAIDADLNAGAITQEQARTRRDEVGRESDFYGAMDGASKFVRGDAVAGILILFVNLLGGIAVGMLQHDMAFGDAAHTYSLLTIGDGLVAQIPALILSTAAAILVTRVSSTQDIGGQIYTQLFDHPRALGVTAGVLGGLGLIPGMPNVAFLMLAGVCAAAAWRQNALRNVLTDVAPAVAARTASSDAPRELSWDDVSQPDALGLEVGYRLIPLVDKAQNGSLLARIKGVRKKLTGDLGFLVPQVHIRDNLDLSPNAYRILISGVVMGESEIHPERDLAINPGRVFGTLPGIAGRDPAFGLEAVWIEHGSREHAQALGYTVVDAATVVATHLSHLVSTHAQDILTREDVQALFDQVAKTSPKLVEDLTPKALPLGAVHRVLRNLLEDRLPIRDLRTIAETLTVHAPQCQDPAVLTGFVRAALGRAIVQHISGNAAELPVMTLDPAMEQILLQALQHSGEHGMGIEPGLLERLRNGLAEATRKQESAGQSAVLLVSAGLRAWMARLTRQAIPALRVLAYSEIPDDRSIRIVATLGK